MCNFAEYLNHNQTMHKIKYFLIFHICLHISVSIRASHDTIPVKNKFLEIHATYTGDAVSNVVGGKQQKAAYLGMLNLEMALNTEYADWWKGGNFYVKATNTHGASPSADIIGDLQIASNIEAGNHTFLQEAWFSQSVSNLSITVGLQDLNKEFAVTEYGSSFLNSSFGIIPTISNNLKAPIFPLTSFGLTLKWEINNRITWLNAIYDGEPTDFAENAFNLSWQLHENDGLLAISEMQFNDNKQLPGSYKIGLYNHSHYLSKLILKNTPDSVMHNSWGAFAYADKTFWKRSNRIFGAFVQTGYGFSPDSKCKMYIGGGFNYLGLAKKDGSDLLGLAVAHAKLQGNARSETSLELTYHFPLNKYLYIQPDIQYIINPSGTYQKLTDSLVGIIRIGAAI